MLASLKEKYSPHLADLYQEYAKAFKGWAQLLWSRGLKKRFGIEEFKDGELAKIPKHQHYLDLNSEDFFKISFLNKFALVLDYSESCSPEATYSYIQSLAEETTKILTRNYRRRRSSYISDMRLSNMFDTGVYCAT